MQLNGLQKTTALRLIEGVEIQQDASTFSVNFLTVVPFFKVHHTSSLHYGAPHVVTLVAGGQCLLACSAPSDAMTDLAAQCRNAWGLAYSSF